MNNQLPQGFRAAGVHCGIKQDPDKLDLSLVVSDNAAVAVGVYTQNLVCAAPVKLCQQRTPSDQIRGVVINRSDQKYHTLLKQPRINVVGTFTTRGLFNHHGYKIQSACFIIHGYWPAACVAALIAS